MSLGEDVQMLDAEPIPAAAKGKGKASEVPTTYTDDGLPWYGGVR